jgi:hypothetical protein
LVWICFSCKFPHRGYMHLLLQPPYPRGIVFTTILVTSEGCNMSLCTDMHYLLSPCSSSNLKLQLAPAPLFSFTLLLTGSDKDVLQVLSTVTTHLSHHASRIFFKNLSRNLSLIKIWQE